MVKGISAINGIVKTGVISALLAGSTALYASNPIKKDAQPNQTEVVSKEGAEAIKAASIQGVNQGVNKGVNKGVNQVNKGQVPTVNNPRLDATLRKFAKNQDEKNEVNEIISEIYKEEGTFLGSVYVQHEIDRQMLGVLLDGNTDILINNNINPTLGKEVKKIGQEFYKTVKPNAQKVTDWLTQTYSPALFHWVAFDHKPNSEEVIKRLDYIAAEKANLDLDDMIEYHVYCDAFQEDILQNRTDTQAMSDLAAYKMYMIDKLIIKNSLYNYDVFDYNKQYSNGGRLKDYYEDWMNSVKPKGK